MYEETRLNDSKSISGQGKCFENVNLSNVRLILTILSMQKDFEVESFTLAKDSFNFFLGSFGSSVARFWYRKRM